MSKITASMEAVGVAMFEAFKEHLRKEGRSVTAAVRTLTRTLTLTRSLALTLTLTLTLT